MARPRKKTFQTADEYLSAAKALEDEAKEKRALAAEYRKKAKDMETDTILQYLKTHTDDDGNTLYENILKEANVTETTDQKIADAANEQTNEVQVSNNYAD